MVASRLVPWLLLALALLVPLGAAVTPSDLSCAWAGEDDPPGKGGDGGGDEDDPFKDDGPDDFFDTPTTFSKEQVEKAILKGVAWLKKAQQDDGSWGPVVGNAAYGGGAMQGQGYTHPAGSTALALYALLKCRVPLRDPVVRQGFEFLRQRHEKPGSSYETSMLLLAVCATGDPFKTSKASSEREAKLKLSGPYRKWAQDLLAHLLEKKTGPAWRYQAPGTGGTPGGEQDLSSTQLAALSLFAAHRLKIRAPNGVWEDILTFSLAQQDDDGPEVVTKDPLTQKEIRRKSRGFAYIKGQPNPEEGQATGSMTACGIANVMMSRFILTEGGVRRAEWDVRPDAAKVQQAVDDGLAWLESNWSNFQNPRKAQMNVYHLYWLYAVERAMDLVGHQKIGEHFWYSEMGQQLINRQNEDGSWDTKSTHEPTGVLDTSFALLFLKRATQGQIPFPSVTGGTDEPPVDNR